MGLSQQAFIDTAWRMAVIGARTKHSFRTSRLVLPADDETIAPALDVRLIDHVGYTSHYDEGTGTSSWPIPAGLTRAELAYFAWEHDLMATEPAPGDVFLQYARHRREFVHAGIVAGVRWRAPFNDGAFLYEVYSIEGDLDAELRIGGGRTRKVRRKLTSGLGDAFIRWTSAGLAREHVIRAEFTVEGHVRAA